MERDQELHVFGEMRTDGCGLVAPPSAGPDRGHMYTRTEPISIFQETSGARFHLALSVASAADVLWKKKSLPFPVRRRTILYS